MKVLHITSHLNVGGISSYILSLSAALSRRGHRLIIASGGGQLEPQARMLGLTHWRVPLQTKTELNPKLFAATRHLAERLRREPVDLLHAHTRVGQVVAHCLSRALKIPYVATWHGFFRPNLGRRLWPCTGNLTIAISEPVRQSLLREFRVPVQRLRLIHNGVDIEQFALPPDAATLSAYRAQHGIFEHQPVIGSLGRLASGGVKGFDILLAAASQVKREIPNLQVMIVGDGSRLRFLEEQIDRFNLREQVRLPGTALDVRVPLSLMDVFVFPGRRQEGFGLSLIEAMAAGRPVVATRIGAVPEIIEHGRDGWLVDPEDPSSLADGIVHLLKDRSTAARLGRQAQVRVRETFSLEGMTDQVEAVYREVVR